MKKKVLILVVDDEKDITEIYKILLELQGYEVAVANNGLDGLNVVANRPPDLILSDCMMPLMDGVEFARRVRLIPGLQAIPIILMSGAPELHDFSSSPHSVFLKKPLLFESLTGAIDRLLPNNQY